MLLSCAGCVVWAGERVGAGASRKLFRNRTPKSMLLEETAREGEGTQRAPSSASSCHFGVMVGKRG